MSRILIDGRNVQRALERGSNPGSLPTSALIARVKAAFPPPTEVELILDGHPEGSPRGRVAPALSVAFSRDRSADAVIAERAEALLRQLGPVGAWSVVVVTDDREVRDAARRSGVRIEGTAWLAERLARAVSGGGQAARGSTIGNRSRR